MIYVPRPMKVEAVYLDSIQTALEFLRPGEFTVISRDGLHVLTEAGTVFAPIAECYLVRWPTGIDVMDKDEFEAMYEEAQ